MIKFRFEDLDIWKMSINLANELLDIADNNFFAMRYALCAMQLQEVTHA